MLIPDTTNSLQAHPEFLSKVTKSSPPFLGLVAASAGILDQIIEEVKTEGLSMNGVAEF